MVQCVVCLRESAKQGKKLKWLCRQQIWMPTFPYRKGRRNQYLFRNNVQVCTTVSRILLCYYFTPIDWLRACHSDPALSLIYVVVPLPDPFFHLQLERYCVQRHQRCAICRNEHLQVHKQLSTIIKFGKTHIGAKYFIGMADCNLQMELI